MGILIVLIATRGLPCLALHRDCPIVGRCPKTKVGVYSLTYVPKVEAGMKRTEIYLDLKSIGYTQEVQRFRKKAFWQNKKVDFIQHPPFL